MKMLSFALGLTALSTPTWGQPVTEEAAKEATLGQAVTFADLEGAEIQATIIREQVVRREGRQIPVKVHIDWKLLISPEGTIKHTFSPTAYTPRGKRQGQTLAGSFTVDKPHETSSMGGGHAVWLFKDGTLTFLRTFKGGAYRNSVAFARGADSLTCTVNESFAREKGAGSVTLNSPIDGVATTLVSSRQVSSSCRVTKR